MIRPLLDGSTIPILEKVAAFGERRHEVLAGNLANIDTPGYRMRDLPVAAFQKALAEATERLRSGQSIGTEASASPASAGSASPDLDHLFPPNLFRPSDAASKNLTFQDGNNRSVEYEVMEMTKNAMLQKYALQVMIAQMNLLQSVIAERP
ncbi:MAG TPA: hypothetical protein EYP14_15310 [Planctomycetaceae bacterium]|nr:hypothetical protein [Planctomycetaceae bacterium]